MALEWRDDQEYSDGNATAAKDLVERAGVFGIIEQSATVCSASAARLSLAVTVFVSYTPFEAQTPGVRRFLDAMNRYAPELSDRTQLFAVHGYVSADLFLRGLELAGDCPTRAGFIDALGHSTYDADGLLPSPINLATSRGVLNNCYFFMRVNAAGTGFEPVPSDGTNIRWCGDPVAR